MDAPAVRVRPGLLLGSLRPEQQARGSIHTGACAARVECLWSGQGWSPVLCCGAQSPGSQSQLVGTWPELEGIIEIYTQQPEAWRASSCTVNTGYATIQMRWKSRTVRDEGREAGAIGAGRSQEAKSNGYGTKEVHAAACTVLALLRWSQAGSPACLWLRPPAPGRGACPAPPAAPCAVRARGGAPARPAPPMPCRCAHDRSPGLARSVRSTKSCWCPILSGLGLRAQGGGDGGAPAQPDGDMRSLHGFRVQRSGAQGSRLTSCMAPLADSGPFAGLGAPVAHSDTPSIVRGALVGPGAAAAVRGKP